MAEIKFHCPECRQKIGVDDSAVGMRFDCPSCRSALVIPADGSAPVETIVKRRLVALAGSTDAAYEELERKEQEITAARAEGAALRAEMETSKSELDRLRAAAAESMQTTALELDRLRGSQTEASAEIDRLRGELAASASECATLARRVAGIEPLRKDHSLTQAEVARLRSELSNLTAQQEARLAAVRSAAEEADKERAEWQTRLVETVAAKELAARLQRELDEAREKLAALGRERDVAREEAAARAAERDEARQRLAAREKDLEAAGGGIATLEREAAENGTRRIQAESKTREAAEAAKVLQQRLDATQADLRARERELAEAREALTAGMALREECARVKSELAGAAGLASELAAKVTALDAELAAAKADADVLRSGMQDAESARLQAYADLAARQTQMDDALARLKVADEREAPERMQLRLDQSLAEREALVTERDSLKAELEAVKAGLERARQHVNVLQMRRDQMRDEIADFKVRLGEAPDAVT